MVEFNDGSVLAQMGKPDMRLPIQYALGFPERLPHRWSTLDLLEMGGLAFEKPKFEDFPCLTLARKAMETGGTMTAVLNAANEVAVRLFLCGKIGFLDIARMIEEAMEKHEVDLNPDFNALMEADRWAREYVNRLSDATGGIKKQ